MRFGRRPRRSRGDHHRLYVEVGQVACPRGGSVDVEECFRCPAFVGLEQERFEVVVCAPRERVFGLPAVPVGS